jgi:predicted ATP-dependent serine protease
MTNKFPIWVCQDCGNKASKKQFAVSTWHLGKCDICRKEKFVTEYRDFYYGNEKTTTTFSTENSLRQEIRPIYPETWLNSGR